MILSGKEIASRIGNDIIIDPYNKDKLNPNSYNLSLHDELLVYKEFPLDMKKENQLQNATFSVNLKLKMYSWREHYGHCRKSV